MNRHKFKGKQQTIDTEQIKKLKREGLGATEIGRQMHINRSSVYRLLRGVEI